MPTRSPLRIPVVRQGERHHCAQACLAAIAAFWGRLIPDPGALLPGTPHDGTDPRTVEAALRIAGFVVLAGSMRLTDLAYFTRTGRPVLCLTQHADGCGHYVVVGGCARRWVHVMDPAVGLTVAREADWCRDWADVDRYGVVYSRWGLTAWPDD